MLLAGDADHHLIEVSSVSRRWKTHADPVGEALAKLQSPLPHGFMGDLNLVAASISSTMRRLSKNRKYNQTA
jgi:hypothetical protein